MAGYKGQILDCLTRLGKLVETDPASVALVEALKNDVARETNESVLFEMFQTVREMLAREIEGKEEAPFAMRTPDGTELRVKNLAHAKKVAAKIGGKREQ